MPGGDRTGPMGAGPRTGRARGFCAGYDSPGYLNPDPGFRGYGGGWGRGWGHGWGRGWGHGWGRGRGHGWGRGWAWHGSAPWVPPTVPWGAWPLGRDDELKTLRAEAAHMESILSEIRSRMEALEKDDQEGD